MTNSPPMTREEIKRIGELMGKLRALGVAIEGVINEIKEYQRRQQEHAAPGEEHLRIAAAEPGRWLAMGRTDMQTGLMKLTRSVAQPGFF